MIYFTNYSAPPARDAFFMPTESIWMRRAIRQSAIPLSQDDIRAIEHEFSAGELMLAQDDDGWYFAIRDAADDIAVRLNGERIEWRYTVKHENQPDLIDRAVRQHFAGDVDAIHAWEQACEAGYGPDGPVGIDGWVSVRLPD